MRIFITREPGGVDTLKLEEAPPPGPLGAGDIRIAMRAASVNYRDLMWMGGTFGPPGPNGLIPCSDGAGEVIEAGPDVTRFKVGDRVALAFNPDWIGGRFKPSPGAVGLGSLALPGTMRDEIVAHQSAAVLIPSHLSYAEGAAFPCAGVTAWHALCGAQPLMPGMTVLTQGAGGVSLFAMQFAKLFGARVIMTSSSPERCARLKAMGADEVIDYNAEPEWNKAVRAMTGGMGVDLTIDIGGAETLERSLGSTRSGGRVALVGLLSGWPSGAASLFSSGADITPIKVGSREDHENMHRAIAFHQLRPHISASYSFEQLPDALRALKAGQHMGKIVLTFD
ncbi:MAG TPA: NAD(P)-dependent alcohol dehydrogenase [Sphingobium sp.]|nr:NAD(P)-dependent alcohol dehydrogenase [Sphingobium sp.]